MEILNVVLKAVGAFALSFAGIYAVASLRQRLKAKKRKRKRTASTQEVQKQAEKKQEGKKEPRFKLNKMDVILIIIAVTLVAFTMKMIDLFETYMAVPDTLITCVFAVCGGECGAMSWIKTSNEKYRERKWQLEDEKRMEEAAHKAASSDCNDP